MSVLAFMLGLFLVASPGLSFPEKDIPNVRPDVLDMLLATKQYELFSKLVKVDNVKLVVPSEKERSVNPMFNEELEFGDMILPKAQTEEARQGIRFERYGGSKWQNRNVPYAISNEFSSSERGIIERSISKWNSQVRCVKFNPVRNENDYVMFFPGEGCWSYLGKIGGQQSISLQKNGCLYESTVLHEMDHAIGFAHEQNRSDRDNSIEMLWDNIPERWKSQYQKTNSRDYGLQGGYDYYSIMHYPVNAPGTNRPAFRVKQNGIDERRIGRGSGFTQADLDKISMQYC